MPGTGVTSLIRETLWQQGSLRGKAVASPMENAALGWSPPLLCKGCPELAPVGDAQLSPLHLQLRANLLRFNLSVNIRETKASDDGTSRSYLTADSNQDKMLLLGQTGPVCEAAQPQHMTVL